MYERREMRTVCERTSCEKRIGAAADAEADDPAGCNRRKQEPHSDMGKYGAVCTTTSETLDRRCSRCPPLAAVTMKINCHGTNHRKKTIDPNLYTLPRHFQS